ncbi:hypothetical protein C1H76_7689 [Elsinoe australis]|uniref:Uncharacterized protein n=1 Tax=Elsinoe australis TaxID=40998 RepID=A0A4U7APU4_9PEZI|nr:hypothetical protein C1H76_7689 [Elsinoe australis]
MSVPTSPGFVAECASILQRMRDLDSELSSNNAKSQRQLTLVKTLIGEENNMLSEEQRIWHVHIQETSERQRLLGQWVALHKKEIDFLSEKLSSCAEEDGNKIRERLTELKKTMKDYSELARVPVSKTAQTSPSSSF